MSNEKPSTAKTPSYVSNGTLTTKPLGARFSSLADSAFVFVMLYLTTLFSTDSYAAALGSPYRRHASTSTFTRPSGVRDTPSPYNGRLTGSGRGGTGTGDRPRTMGQVRGGGDSLRLVVGGCGSCG